MARRRIRRKMTDKQARITILCIAAAAILLIGALIVIGSINKNTLSDPHAGHNHSSSNLSDGHYEGDGHNHGANLADGHYEGDGHDHGTTTTKAAVTTTTTKAPEAN